MAVRRARSSPNRATFPLLAAGVAEAAQELREKLTGQQKGARR